DLSGITVRDAEGHTARLNGWVKHKLFKEPRFDFALSNAHNFLCYNETPRENPIWHGKVYGNGSAFVSGEPGVVNINVDIATAPRSTFTFVLSDQEVAEQYSFLTFRDKNHISAELTDTLTLRRDTSMDLVNRLRALAAAHGEEESPSDYNITIQTRITPEAEIVLVMDPVGGDRIRAYGSGSLRLDYGSANNDLKMYGTYTLDRGRYNFTLQDIIIKDFTIKPGSEISFRGDPYAAQLDIKAAYSLNANLSDLDESFLHDKDLNRTSVPVNAIMNVSGDMRQPEISFDLEFPTLNADVYRKVRSIVSTDDMMNRQIIYLLALNRFYTPEYMASATRGNELVSVASSTISSQLQ
ncbi:MAG: translocation/assembly module TamB, partial [Muribaculaceae bacterium]|nr:translocation/assembly module TamB [Muribaculaceae bacterium]